uniref:ABC transporter domain-containing protein n=1 Tax=Strongyloides papillosus TaxID=174720 RepID=A0A0N5B7M9_STREA
MDKTSTSSNNNSLPLTKDLIKECSINSQTSSSTSSLSIKGVELTWSNIEVSVPYGKSRKTVLKGVSGIAKPGEMLAIMGASGAGKTTLLNLLTNIDQTKIKKSGSVRVNGKYLTVKEMRTISAYVQQVDVFAPRLTVFEQLTISAKLRMGRKCDQHKKEETVERLLRQMRLGDCKNTMIGSPTTQKGISIGEKKRLAIACELMDDPKILFCDEPTSGLDSYMAFQVVTAMEHQAKFNKTIVSTIHQPSSEVFYKFDKVCLMANGKVAYFGPVKELTKFWYSISTTLDCPPSYNPADFAIKMLSNSDDSDQSTVDARIQMITEAYEKSEYCQGILNKVIEINTQTAIDDESDKILTEYAASFWTQLQLMIWRGFKTLSREPMLFRTRIVQTLFTVSILVALYWNMELNASTIQNFQGLLYLTALQLNMFLFSTAFTLTSELPLAIREYKAGIYGLWPYYIGKSLSEVPQITLLGLIFSTALYWSTGLHREIYSFIKFASVNTITINTSLAFAHMAACIFFVEEHTMLFLCALGYPLVLFAGFYMRSPLIPLYMKPFEYLSFYQYAHTSIVANQWSNIGHIEGCIPSNETILPNSIQRHCQYSTGQEILESNGLTNSSYWYKTLSFIGLFLVFKIIGGVALNIRGRMMK